MEFNDRFGSTLLGVNLETATEDQVNLVSPLLIEMVSVIRGFSVLIRRKSIKEIHDVIVNQSDPRIALVLAAARDNSGNQLFPTLSIVKAFMFGRTDDTIVNADVSFNEKSIFVSGIRRVSCSLTAAYLIGQLSQVPEQAQHALTLEKQALDDLNRILQVPEIRVALDKIQTEQGTKPRIYFQPTSLNIGSRELTVSVYLSNSTTSWVEVAKYSNSLNTSNIIADITDYINNTTINTRFSNVLASPVLGGVDKLHFIEFDSRLRNVDVNTELVSIKFHFQDLNGNLIELPFIWGVDKSNLLTYAINSCIIQVDSSGNASKIDSLSNEFALDTLYFRRRLVDEANNPIVLLEGQVDTLEYRISPTQTDSNLIDIEYISAEEQDRPNLIATALLNSLFELKEDTKALGAIIQNDPTNITNSYTGLQLVAWTITNREVELILDILNLPEDIEVALGNSKNPLTTFSSKPRSLKVVSQYEKPNLAPEDLSNASKVRFVKGRQSSLLNKLNDIRESDYKSYRRSLKYRDTYTNIPNVDY